MPATESATGPSPCPDCGSVPLPGAPAGHCAACLGRAAFGCPDPDEPAGPEAEEPQPWSVLGDCELLEEIGRGGMGVVYRARQRRLGREVAVKVLRGGQFAGAEARQRFQAEAEHAAALRHPGIVTVHDFGEEQGVCWISMEFIAGRNLDDVTRHQPMPAREAAQCVRQVARALDHAHRQGVLHRDLKPSNILLDTDGAPHIADFGIARRLDGATAFTRTGQILGSPGFAAPEQALRGEADERTDVYGLGSILYSILTSRPPFQGPTAESVLVQLREDDPLPPRRLNPSVPRDLENIALKCLSRDPARRYPGAAAIAEDLTAFLEGRPVSAHAVSPLGKAWRWCRRRPAMASAVAVAVLSLTGGTLVSLVQAQRAREAASLARESEARALESAAETRRTLYAATTMRVQTDLQEGSPLAAEALTKLIPAPGQPDLRGWEWHWLHSQLHLGRQVRDDGVTGDPRAVAWSANGKRVAVSTLFRNQGRTRSVQILNADTLAVELTLPGFLREVPFLDWHPDGIRLLASEGSGVVSCWNTVDGTRLWTLEVDPVDVRNYHPPRAFWSPDGSLFAVHSFKSGLMLHRAADGATVQQLSSLTPAENPLAWHPAGDRIAIPAQPREVQIISLAGEMLARLPQPESASALAWSPDGTRLAVGTTGSQLRLCDPAHPDRATVVEITTGAAGHLLWSRDGRHLVAGGWTGVPVIINATTGSVERHLYGHGMGWITGMALQGDRLLTWSKDATLREWTLTGERVALLLPGAVTRLRFLGSGEDLCADLHETAPFGRTVLWQEKGALHSESFRWGRAAAWSPDGSRLAVLRNLDPGKYGLSGLIAPGALIEFRLGRSPGMPELRAPLRTGFRASEVYWSPQGDRLLVTSPGSRQPFCAVLDSSDGREICRFPASLVFNTSSPELPDPVAWSPDGKRIALGAGAGGIYDAATGEPILGEVTAALKRFAREIGGPIVSLAWSPGMQSLAIGYADSGHILLLDAHSGTWQAKSALHNGWVRALAFSPDGTRLATAGRDRTVKLLDASTLSPLLIFKEHEADVRALAWSADGRILASADTSGVVITRRIPKPAPAQ